MKRVQRVVLREKDRRARLSRLKNLAFKTLKLSALSALAVSASVFVHRFLFSSDFFMVKWIQIEAPRSSEKMRTEIEKEISHLKGRSIFRFSPGAVERDIQAKYPEIGSLRLSRSLPDTVKAAYAPRDPVVFFKLKGSIQGADAGGNVFSLSLSSASLESLPELVLASTGPVPSLVAFVNFWRASGASSFPRKISADETGEVSFIGDDGVRVVWGASDPLWFKDKLARLEEVRADLKRKSMRAQYVNLRGVPQSGEALLGKRKVMGRVVVRPLDAQSPEATVPRAGRNQVADVR